MYREREREREREGERETERLSYMSAIPIGLSYTLDDPRTITHDTRTIVPDTRLISIHDRSG